MKERLQQSVVVRAGEGGYHTYRIPAVVQARDGSVVLFLEGRKYEGGDFGEIHLLALRSADRGAAWSPPVVVHAEATEARNVSIGNPCPVVDAATGAIVLAFTRDNQQVFVTRSADHGATWEPARDITPSVRPETWTRYWVGPGHGLQRRCGPHRGRLILPSYHLEQDDGRLTMRSHMLLSDDGGTSWRVGRSTGLGPDIPETTFRADWVPEGFVWAGCECMALEFADGSLYLTVRNQVRYRERKAFSRSFDAGESWSPLALHDELPGLKCQSSVVRFSPADGPWGEGALYAGLTRSRPDGGERGGLAVCLSLNGARRWSRRRMLHEGPAAYSDLCVLDDGHVLCCYEGGDDHAYQSIRLARFDREWVLGGRRVDAGSDHAG